MNTDVICFDEPLLEFRYGQEMAEPHDGLSLFGPYDTDFSSHPRNISYAIVGSQEGIEIFSQWSHCIQSVIYPEGDRRLWPLFPGFEAAFACNWPEQPVLRTLIDSEKLTEAVSDLDHYKRTGGVVDLYIDAIGKLKKHDEVLNVVVCIVPDIVYQNCRPKSVVTDGIGYKVSSGLIRKRGSGQLDFLDPYNPQRYTYSPDFRRQIKARAMAYEMPIQIIRESTLRLTPRMDNTQRGLTTLSDRSWNLGVALYYKAGGKPWRLKSAREGVCYIGIAYRRQDPNSASQTACCAAQMFLDSGDGIVFMGEYGPWYSPADHQFHITKEAANHLLSGILSTYKNLEGKPLKEVFLHCRSGIDEEEFAGYRSACPPEIKVVGIRVRQERNGLKLFREGNMPVLRGTFWKTHERSGYLWASGFKPRLGTYDGAEIPLPVRIDIQHGEADIKLVAKDILALTKLNYNACRLGESEPVTIRFSDAVGEILVSNPAVTDRSPKFKFYI
ncbi:MAG: hypothetical protein ABSA18_14110 [Dehalococcoidia bacterium]